MIGRGVCIADNSSHFFLLVIFRLRWCFFQRTPIISNFGFVPCGCLLPFKGKKGDFWGQQGCAVTQGIAGGVWDCKQTQKEGSTSQGRTFLFCLILFLKRFRCSDKTKLLGFGVFWHEALGKRCRQALLKLKDLVGFCWLVINNRNSGNETSPAAPGFVSPSALMSPR